MRCSSPHPTGSSRSPTPPPASCSASAKRSCSGAASSRCWKSASASISTSCRRRRRRARPWYAPVPDRRFRSPSPARASTATIRSSRAISSSRATSPIASAPSGASATWHATTPSRRFRTACSSTMCCSRRSRALRAGQVVAVLYLDMDRFKEVNDTFGHDAGDRVLEVLAERLTRAVPRETVVGRLAGDEFALFVDSLPADADNRGPIAQLARALLTEVSRPFQLNQHEVFLTASVGIAFCPRDAENVIDLIRNADAAMYYSKQNGGNTFAFYSPEMNAAAVERLMLKSKLRRALERDELEIRYQPKVDLRTGRISGAEALLRWRLPGHGDIPPSHFIPLAEETNLILDIGEWVLNRVCLDYRQMQAQGGDPGRISLNLSLKQLRQASFILRCRSVFRRHHVSPTAFELEITETTLMADPQRTVRLLDELYAMGLHLSIDDFGTGYSSLSALQQFPIGTLKIDQSFVRDASDDAGDATIVRTIIEMGRSLGMEVIAEGVESQRQLDFLRANACNFGQGRLFGEPCSADELLALLARQSAGGAAPFAHLLRNADEAAFRSA